MTNADKIKSYAWQLQENPWMGWRWADGGGVIEHIDGPTICYRPELEKCLECLTRQGLPSFRCIILLIAASKDNYPQTPLAQKDEDWESDKQDLDPAMVEAVDRADDFLRLVHALPKDLRSGEYFLHLLLTVFEGPDRVLSVEESKELLSDFRRGALDAAFKTASYEMAPPDMTLELRPLVRAAKRFPDVQTLENVLRTGLPTPPKPAEAGLPQVQIPDEAATPLLDELLEDPRTSGLATLARHLVAALNIPMQARGSNDLPLGGVSDITNRGNFDRLLLSELANDDLTLTARLANSEALYLRREEPPVKVEKERIVLIDTTMKLWGLPRGFAVSAALACQERNPFGNGLRAFALGGNRFAPAELATKSGVLKLMERLDASLHPAAGLENCLKDLPKQNKEVILITSEELLEDPLFSMRLMALQPQLDYLITVSRSGRMRLIEVFNGHRRLLGESQFDLSDLLFRTPKNLPRPKKFDHGDLPAFFGQSPAPLYFPATSIRLRPNNTKIFSASSMLVLTENRRILYWESGQVGALELFPYIPVGADLYMHQFEERYLLIALHAHGTAIRTYFIYDTTTASAYVVPVEKIVPWSVVYFNQGYLYYYRQTESYAIKDPRRVNCVDGIDEMATPLIHEVAENRIGKVHPKVLKLSDMKKVINPGYSTLQNVKYVRLTRHGELNIEGRSLRLGDDDQFRFEFESGHHASPNLSVRTEESYAGLAFPDNPTMKLRRLRWEDCTMGFIDPRGFVHLRSSDPSLPEVTIALILDMPTALWASDGACTGSTYFLGPANPHRISGREFHRRYLWPLIQKIMLAP